MRLVLIDDEGNERTVATDAAMADVIAMWRSNRSPDTIAAEASGIGYSAIQVAVAAAVEADHG